MSRAGPAPAAQSPLHGTKTVEGEEFAKSAHDILTEVAATILPQEVRDCDFLFDIAGESARAIPPNSA